MENNNVTINLKVSDHILQFSCKNGSKGAEMNILSSEGKPKNSDFEIMSYISSMTPKKYLDDVVLHAKKNFEVFTGRPSTLPSEETFQSVLNAAFMRLQPDPNPPALSSLPVITNNTLNNSPNQSLFEEYVDGYRTVMEDMVKLDMDSFRLLDNHPGLKNTLETCNRLYSNIQSQFNDPRGLLLAKIMRAKTLVNIHLDELKLGHLSELGVSLNDRAQLELMLEHLDNDFEYVKSWEPNKDLTQPGLLDYLNNATLEEQNLIRKYMCEDPRWPYVYHPATERGFIPLVMVARATLLPFTAPITTAATVSSQPATVEGERIYHHEDESDVPENPFLGQNPQQ